MSLDPRDLDALHDAARKNLGVFTQLAWPELNRGTPLIWARHNDAVAEHLQAVTEGQIRKLIVCVPPGASKTTLASQTWPVWWWLRDPHMRWGFAAYGGDLSKRDSVKRRDLILSRWFQEAFAPSWQLKADESLKMVFGNTVGGEMRAMSVGGAATGFHFDVQVVDDPLRAMDIYTVRLAQCIQWFDEQWASRLRDPSRSAQIIIAQRLHDRDLPGVKAIDGTWTVLRLPMEYESKHHCATRIGWEDWRTNDGERLCPERWPESVIADKKRNARVWAAQYQQRPQVGDGTVFREGWMQFYHMDDQAIPGCVPFPGVENMDRVITSWDLTFDGGAKNDYNAGGVWGRKGVDAYLIDRVNAQMRFTEQQWAVRRLVKKWPEARQHLIEAKANGAAVIDVLSRPAHDPETGRQSPGIPGILGVTPRAPKVVRAELAAGYFQTGNVYLPHPSVAPWVNDYIAQLCAFPTGDNDDEVDQTSQALLDLMRTSTVTMSDLDAILPSARRVPSPDDTPDGPRDPRHSDDTLTDSLRMAQLDERQKDRERQQIAARLGLDIVPGAPFSTRTGRR